jgi:lysozyme
VIPLRGKVSWFGGPDDYGVAPDEPLAFIYEVSDQPLLFLSEQPPDTTGLARRLDPAKSYLAMRWDYDETPREMLLNEVALVRAIKTGKEYIAAPADWGPGIEDRIADISPGLMDALGIETDDECEIIFPYRENAAMSEPVKARVIDLSHWDPADDYSRVADDGILGVIYKATQGTSNRDDTYVEQQRDAKAAGLLWGAYHFADGSDVDQQIANFLTFADPDPDELFCLDWEDNPAGTKMSVAQVKQWVEGVEDALGRPGQCVIYGGNTIKESLGSKVDPWFGSRRLWLCQYGSTPVVQASWKTYWLWQFTDGEYGPSPHSIDGVGPCDINSYKGNDDQLTAEWADGTAEPAPAPGPGMASVHLNVTTSGEIAVSVAINGEVIYGDGEV